MLPDYASPRACRYHYGHMARGNYRDYLRGEVVWVKKYFYVLCPLLAVLWIEAGRGVVPMAFEVLVEAMVQDPAVRQAIAELLARKQAGDELDREPSIPILSAFIEQELTRLEQNGCNVPRPQADIERLNVLFRTVLERVWA
jgi:hypothetical protein